MKKDRETSKKAGTTDTSQSSNGEKEIRGKAAKMDRAMRGVDRTPKQQPKPGQPRKDSSSKRINADNERESKFKRQFESDSKADKANDIGWYSKNPELLKAAGSIPFGSVLGTPISESSDNYIVPGIMVIDWQPAYGNNSVAINQSFNSQYSFVVHANSRNYRYDSPDLGILEVAGMDVFNIIGTMMWAFGVMKYYEAERNYYYPKGILAARGFVLTNLRQNQSQMWYDINDLVNQTKQIWIPNTMPIADRWYWMNTTYFTDAPGTTSQTYLFNQDTFYVYDETSIETGGCVAVVDETGNVYKAAPGSSSAFHPGVNKSYDWSTWVTVAQGMINALISAQDRGMIFGDILNAYGADRIRALANIPSDFTLPPTYNTEVQSQFENSGTCTAQIAGVGQVNNELVTVWDKDKLYTAYHLIENFVDAAPNFSMLNFHFPEQPTPEQIVVATRAKSTGVSTNPTGYYFNWTNSQIATGKVLQCNYFCSELYHMKYIMTSTGVSGGAPVYDVVPVPSTMYYNSTAEVITPSITKVLQQMIPFDWMPSVNLVTSNTITRPTFADATVTLGTLYTPIADWDNYATLSPSNIQKLHDMAIFSLLDVPVVI